MNYEQLALEVAELWLPLDPDFNAVAVLSAEDDDIDGIAVRTANTPDLIITVQGGNVWLGELPVDEEDEGSVLPAPFEEDADARAIVTHLAAREVVALQRSAAAEPADEKAAEKIAGDLARYLAVIEDAPKA